MASASGTNPNLGKPSPTKSILRSPRKREELGEDVGGQEAKKAKVRAIVPNPLATQERLSQQDTLQLTMEALAKDLIKGTSALSVLDDYEGSFTAGWTHSNFFALEQELHKRLSGLKGNELQNANAALERVIEIEVPLLIEKAIKLDVSDAGGDYRHFIAEWDVNQLRVLQFDFIEEIIKTRTKDEALAPKDEMLVTRLQTALDTVTSHLEALTKRLKIRSIKVAERKAFPRRSLSGELSSYRPGEQSAVALSRETRAFLANVYADKTSKPDVSNPQSGAALPRPS
jgi:hypothetical protein